MFATKADDFGSTQTGLHGQQQKRPVTAPAPAAEVGSGEQGGDFDAGEEGDGWANITLARDGENPLCQCAVFRRMQGHIAEEGMDGGKTDIAATGAVVAVVFEMIEEGAEERGVEIRQGHFRRSLAQLPLSIGQQQAEGIAVARQGMGACLSLSDEAIGEEGLKESGERPGGAHGRDSS